MTHLEIVTFLVESGANILRANYNGGTCLINSVQSVPLCEYLLKHGAAVNALDIQQKTALHYAIQEHRLETTKLLLQYHADPYMKSRYGDDALQTSCLKGLIDYCQPLLIVRIPNCFIYDPGATQIFEYLIAHVPYRLERVADAYELMGSTCLDEHHDSQLALKYWRAAVQLRHSVEPPIRKDVHPPAEHFNYSVEFQTLEELENLSADVDQMRTQSLLICERIVGPAHKDAIFRLMYRGAAYADSLRYVKVCMCCFSCQYVLLVDRKNRTPSANLLASGSLDISNASICGSTRLSYACGRTRCCTMRHVLPPEHWSVSSWTCTKNTCVVFSANPFDRETSYLPSHF